MNKKIFLTLLFLSPHAFAGDDVTETLSVVAANPTTAQFLVLEDWLIESQENPVQFPRFLSHHRLKWVSSFMDLGILSGEKQETMGTAPYAKKVGTKLKEILKAYEAAGFSSEGITKLQSKVDDKGYATITLPDGSSLREIARPQPRKKNDLQREEIDLEKTDTAGKKSILEKNVVRLVVRSFPREPFHAAYYIKSMNSVVGLYGNPDQEPAGRSEAIWVVKP